MDQNTKNVMRKHGITVSAIAAEVMAYAAELASMDPRDIAGDDGEAYGDIRLQLVDGSWAVHTGDAQYDTDHRGAWGYASVTPDAGVGACTEIARDLIGEACDAYANTDN